MGFFRDFQDDMVPDGDAGKLQDVAEKAENEEEETMSGFDGADVDKDLLNQIFSDEEEHGDDTADADTVDADTADADIADIDIAGADTAGADAPQETAETEFPAATSAFGSDAQGDGRSAENETTLITRGTTINGGISSDGSLEIMGTITGDVECMGKVSVFGQISGNVTAHDVLVQTKRLVGNIESECAVEVSMGTIVIGDITGTSASISGAVKGNIDVNGPVIVDSTAIVKGSIKAKSIQVNTGAVVDGYCSLNYAGVDLDDFFEEK